MMINPFIVSCLTLVLGGLVAFLSRLYQHRKFFKGLPQPPHSFIWGHLKVMGEVSALYPPNTHPQAYLTSIAHKYNLKGMFYMDLWPVAESMVVITDLDLMEQVQVRRAYPVHQQADDFLAPIVGRNTIATSNGKTWKMLHGNMAPAFAPSHVKNLVTVMTEEVLIFRQTLDQLAETREVFSMEDTAAKLIFDIIARIVFHFPLNAQTRGSQYFSDLREMVHLVDAQFSFNPLVKLRTYLRRNTILKRLHKSINNQVMERYRLLNDEQIVPQKKDPYSILDLMLREHVQESGQKGTTAKLTSEYVEILITNIKGLLLGGHGTTTDTFCYILMLLSKHPEVVNKLREEHDRVFDPDFEETMRIVDETPYKLNDLEYTTAVIKETLRLFPVGFGVRQANSGDTLSYDGQTCPIDNNLVIVPLQHYLHYDPKVHPDASKFNPDRFIGENAAPRNAFRTFGRGARACLGQNLAIEELRVILLFTIRDYDFKCADLKPNAVPQTSYTEMDTIFGNIVFQELALEARPRGGMMMTVSKNQK